ncbi:unnamed protein product [Discosporangium mesarthrocarpum]
MAEVLERGGGGPPATPRKHILGGDNTQSLDPMEVFESKRKVQRELEEGVVKFNLKPKQGIAFLDSVGYLDGKDPHQVAAFLKGQAERLNKTLVGEFLGKEKEYMGGFCVKVLHAYVDSLDLEDMVFDEAIRYYLSGFRLPGEAQKIDRMMEKFAERYCLQNASVFPNPDTAFILAFSVIMLNTDLHNPSIKEDRRMSKEDFMRNNRGIDQGHSLPDEFLEGIYDRIAQSPISLKEDDALRRVMDGRVGGGGGGSVLPQELLSFGGNSTLRQKRMAALSRERAAMLKVE